MSSWIDAIASPLKTAGELVQGLIETRDTIKFGEMIAKLHAQIVAAYQGALVAQTREAACVEEIIRLKRRVAELEVWEADKQRYELAQLPPGVFVYALRREAALGEPMHHICQTCYQRGKKSILHADEPGNGIHHLSCYECGVKLQVGHWIAPRGSARRAGDADYWD